MRVLSVVLSSILFVLSGGCATVLHGSNQELSVTSVPPGARFTVDGEGSHTTPATIVLQRKRDHSLVFELEGYQTEQVSVTHVISGAVAGNILAGGLIGWGVDAMTGAQYRLVPELVNVTLRPLAAGEVVQGVLAKPFTTEDRLNNLKDLLDKDLITEDEYEAMRKDILAKVTD